MEFIRSSEVKIRKPHKCWGCRREFPIGSLLKTSTCADMGKISTTYWCDVCDTIISKMDYYDTQDGFSFGEIIDNINDEDKKLYENKNLLTTP